MVLFGDIIAVDSASCFKTLFPLHVTSAFCLFVYVALFRWLITCQAAPSSCFAFLAAAATLPSAAAAAAADAAAAAASAAAANVNADADAATNAANAADAANAAANASGFCCGCVVVMMVCCRVPS